MSPDSAPLVSIVVASRDRRELLGHLLAALDAQTFPHSQRELIVVDDGSTDDTLEFLATRADVHVVRGGGNGPGTARNSGWRIAQAPLIVFTDDDCEPTPGWLQALVDQAGRKPGAVVQGPVAPNPAQADQFGPMARSLEINGLSPHFETANILYPRDLLERLGGFDENFGSPAGEDTDLGWRAMAAGAEHVFAPEALVYHAVHQKTAKQTLKDAFRASDCVRTYRDYPHMREHLQDGIYFHPSHPLVWQAACAAVLAPAIPAAGVFAVPYAAHLYKRCRLTGSKPSAMPFFVLRDIVEIGAVVRGAVKHRTLLL
ncbi:glycosyltransferase [Solirubrobacter taibaiensis]|nr:glycosyltransferase [Solirubrobacter taibaiensis]